MLHRARMPWILEQPCDPWLWDVPKIHTFASQPRTAWDLADLCVFELHEENVHYFWLETETADICTVLFESVLGPVGVAMFQDKNMLIQKLPHHAQCGILQVTTPVLHVCLSRFP